ncbi:MAG: ABC transporter ATP-binding protein [Pseudolabrys sp.]|nr:ABC transporter ATP-binding protein [Pseudolabrys sp.]
MSPAPVTAKSARLVLDVQGVAHRFGGLRVLEDVNIAAPESQIVGLIGPNGSGKTTLFNIITGFIRPRSGTVSVNGRDVAQDSIQQRSRDGLLRTFQTPKVFDHMTVLENVMMGMHAHTSSGVLATMFAMPSARRELASTRASALQTCERFGIAHLAATRAGELPAGLRRVVELARAHQAKPKLLLLDEPSSGLSGPEIDTLRGWIRVFASEGTTVLLVSHDMGLMDVCDVVNVLYFGRVIATGPMAAIRDDQKVRDAYLGAA